jgi:hypothetical protein
MMERRRRTRLLRKIKTETPPIECVCVFLWCSEGLAKVLRVWKCVFWRFGLFISWKVFLIFCGISRRYGWEKSFYAEGFGDQNRIGAFIGRLAFKTLL